MRFIVIEGLDGAGKDTQAYLLRDYLAGRGEKAVLRIHPAQDNALGRISKKALMGGGKARRIVATLFYGLDVIRSVVFYCRDGSTVIFVRYTIACAYLPRPLIRPAYAVVSRVLPRSEEMFFLDVAPEEALRRVKARGEAEEMFETLPHMEKARARAMVIARDWKVIDGNPAPEKVFQNLMSGLNGSPK
ncbi:MAG: putative thymidylate kinase [Methanocella sp. PtaU1.Bin125]|nr:MAG: putative thymidylate kinase [Methanocella sp. PtaU1.Bin125]